jgi:hypothetical protein
VWLYRSTQKLLWTCGVSRLFIQSAWIPQQCLPLDNYLISVRCIKD